MTFFFNKNYTFLGILGQWGWISCETSGT